MSWERARWFGNRILPTLLSGRRCCIGIAGMWYFGEKAELSYQMESPTPYLDDPALGQVEIRVDGQPLEGLVAHRVRIWNSGNRPIKDVPVRLVLGRSDKNIVIFGVHHQTDPPCEFGEVAESIVEQNSRRFRYSLLNPGDSDSVTVLANRVCPIELFTKAEGMSVRRVTDEKFWVSELVTVCSLLIAALAVCVAAFTYAKFDAAKSREEISARVEELTGEFAEGMKERLRQAEVEKPLTPRDP